MSNATVSDQNAGQNSDMASALFAHLVVQQANMAMMMMGQTPHPETGQSMRDLEAAKLFIDTLEMIEGKTRGNLSAQEQNLLKQTLMNARMAFVEAANAPGQPEKSPEPAAAPTPNAPSGATIEKPS